MGAWGHRGFDNDAALDWLSELGGVAALRRTLKRATRGRWLEVDGASAVIAAAEVVAAARGHAARDLPDEVAAWLEAHAAKLVAADARLARDAVARVLAASELQELWAEVSARGPWHRAMEQLEKRLSRPARTAARKTLAIRRVRPAPAKDEIESRRVESPDRTLTASASSYRGTVTVTIEAKDGGGSIAFFDGVPLDAIGLRWIDDATLEVRHPASAKGSKRDRSWFFCGRTVQCRYRRGR